MKKYVLAIICLLCVCTVFTACKPKVVQPTINYQRKLIKYFPDSETLSSKKIALKKTFKSVDLSDGKALKYEANLGPKDVDFDFKVNTKY